MYKSELIKLLQSNLDQYGDSEIQVEVVTNLSENGKVYDIVDVTNAIGFNFEADYITCFVEENNL